MHNLRRYMTSDQEINMVLYTKIKISEADKEDREQNKKKRIRRRLHERTREEEDEAGQINSCCLF